MNIMLTNRCNGTCKYCFLKSDLAQEDVPVQYITMENFRIVLKYAHHLISIGATRNLNIMGGEPTLHPQFQKIFRLALTYRPGNSDFIPITIFTNGLFSEEICELLKNESCAVMVNVNHPDSYREGEWELINKNLATLATADDAGSLLTLSLNIDTPNQDIDYLLDLANKHKIKRIRADISRPEPKKTNTFIKMGQIATVIPTLLKLSKNEGIEVNTDCCFPVCSISNEQIKEFAENNVELSFKCTGGIDVTPDLKLWHCAPLRSVKLGKITDYPNGYEIMKTIENKTNDLRWNIPSKKDCKNCKWWTLKICQGGCLSFKDQNSLTN